MLNKTSSTILLIPSFQPPESFPDLIRELKNKHHGEIVIVNDGSPGEYDRLFNEAVSLGADTIFSSLNLGKGHALQIGFTHIMNNYPDVEFVITCDDDYQHHPDDVLKLISSINGENKIYLGSRSFEGKIPLRSLLGNLFMRYIFLLISKKLVRDSQTGLRCFHRTFLPFLVSHKFYGFNYESITLLHFIRENIEIHEVPIKTIYNNNNRATRFRIVRDSVNVVMSMIRFQIKC